MTRYFSRSQSLHILYIAFSFQFESPSNNNSASTCFFIFIKSFYFVPGLSAFFHKDSVPSPLFLVNFDLYVHVPPVVIFLALHHQTVQTYIINLYEYEFYF